jgi:hypothetical protein
MKMSMGQHVRSVSGSEKKITSSLAGIGTGGHEPVFASIDVLAGRIAHPSSKMGSER